MRDKQSSSRMSPSAVARPTKAPSTKSTARSTTRSPTTARSSLTASAGTQRLNGRSPTTRAARRPEINKRKAEQPIAEGANDTEMLEPVVPRMPGVKSEPRGGGGSGNADALLGEPPCARPLRRAVSNITTDAEEVRRLRAQLQGMKEQVYFMHKMMQGLSAPEKQLLKGKHLAVESKRLSFAGISPVKKTRGSVDMIVMPEDSIPFQDKIRLATTLEHGSTFMEGPAFARSVSNRSEPSLKEAELLSKVGALELQNASLQTQLKQHTQATAANEAELQAQVEDLAAKLAVIDAENIQLHSHIEEFEEENIRLHGALAQLNISQDISLDSNNQGNDTAVGAPDADDDLHDELGIGGLGDEPEDIHERCDAKIHELWATIKTLKAYVETFRVENEDLRVQRDNAIESGKRAWEENVKLAGNNNPQQKIKYVEILKQENAGLVEQVRELQSKLTKKQFQSKNDSTRKDGKGSSGSESEPLEDYPSLDSGDERSDDGSYEERTKLLKKMWARNKTLEEEIVRLQKEKQALAMRQPRSPSADSRLSRQSSARSTTVSASSSRWKK